MVMRAACCGIQHSVEWELPVGDLPRRDSQHRAGPQRRRWPCLRQSNTRCRRNERRTFVGRVVIVGRRAALRQCESNPPRDLRYVIAAHHVGATSTT